MEACCHFVALFGQICPSRRRYNAVLGRGNYPRWTVDRELAPNCERVREGKAQAATHSLGPGPCIWQAGRQEGDDSLPPFSHPQGLYVFLRPLAPLPRVHVVTVSLNHYLRPTEEGCPCPHTHPAWGPQQALEHCILGYGRGGAVLGEWALKACFNPHPFLPSVTHFPHPTHSLVGPVEWVQSEPSLYPGRERKGLPALTQYKGPPSPAPPTLPPILASEPCTCPQVGSGQERQVFRLQGSLSIASPLPVDEACGSLGKCCSCWGPTPMLSL